MCAGLRGGVKALKGGRKSICASTSYSATWGPWKGGRRVQCWEGFVMKCQRRCQGWGNSSAAKQSISAAETRYGAPTVARSGGHV